MDNGGSIRKTDWFLHYEIYLDYNDMLESRKKVIYLIKEIWKSNFLYLNTTAEFCKKKFIENCLTYLLTEC